MIATFSRRRTEAEGRKDGERNIPEMGSYTPAQFEQALIAHGEQEVQRRYEKASSRIAGLLPHYQVYKRHMEERESRLRALVTAYSARKKQLGRDSAAPFPYMYHLILILFLGIGEFPLNTIVFRLFGEAEYVTYVMASTLAITIPLLGLFIGIHLRQSVPRKAGSIVIGVLIPASVGSALFAISMLRNTYVSSQITLTNFAPGDQSHLAFALFSLNALVFCGAVVSSFFAHDPDEKLDNCRKSLIFLDRRRNVARRKLLRVGTKINGEIRRAKSQTEQVRALTAEHVALYRQANMRARTLLPPPSFRRNPEFREIEWWPEVSLDSEGVYPDGG